ncbi:hypothetical protein HPB52_017107 [Rhipicephalus sanguineus]|uniref:CCHC-type domain-containing protein n=1 Tax=Rhipicephalus sanguineus TaxID=34632 RepID=A0A9D4PY46_RHISA|nr:hypothetical protein HPB52_017107 [Rhipicephalus sanguineus]
MDATRADVAGMGHSGSLALQVDGASIGHSGSPSCESAGDGKCSIRTPGIPPERRVDKDEVALAVMGSASDRSDSDQLDRSSEMTSENFKNFDVEQSYSGVHVSERVVLPKLQIPTFSGALRDWQTFWDHFSATIHRNEDLLPIEKFKYLLSYLSGVAKRAIEGIRLTEDNYAIAIRTLTERFGRRDLLINEHIDHLLALPPVKSSADVDKLRLLYDKEKRARLRTARCCYRCGLQNHMARFCRRARSIICSKCNRRHLTILCELFTPAAPTRANATTVNQDEPRIAGRGTNTPRQVALTLRGQRRDIAVTAEALEVPEVCAVTSPPLSTDILQLLCDKNYDAADNFHPDTWHPQEVSVLLGSDVYWKVATGKVDHLTSNLTAVETKFGWTVQGITERERSSSPQCDRGGPPSQRRPFFRGCALQTARPPRYPRVLQGGSGGGFDGARGPRRGFGVRPPFHGNNDTSSRDYDNTRYGDCRDDAVDGPHSLPDRTQQGRPQWRQRGWSVTPPTQPGA